VREALDYAEEQGLAIVPECDFVAAWLDKHPERAAELDVAAS
jgi:predicted GNAT family acetyltransferase